MGGCICISRLKAEAPVITTGSFVAATNQAGFTVTERADAGHLASAVRAVVAVAAGHLARRGQNKIMAAFFLAKTEVTAGLAPLGSVGIDQAPRVAGVGHEVGKFVEKCPAQFGGVGE